MNQGDANNKSRGLLIVMTGASGVGKGTLRERWLRGQDVFYSTSWTTRAPRDGEQNGREYLFKTEEEFLEKIKSNGFLEHAEFVGSHYGTPVEPIEDALSRGRDVILEIEVEGAMQVEKRMAGEAVLIFITPPSLTELRRRLTGRATETPERIEKRLARAREEILEAQQFRYVVVNDDLDRAVEEMLAVQVSERLKQKPGQLWSESEHAKHELAQSLLSSNLSRAELERVINT